MLERKDRGVYINAMSEKLKIAIAGLGTVGAGVFKILKKKSAQLKKKAGREIVITAVNARDRSKDRGVDVSSARWLDSALDLAKRFMPYLGDRKRLLVLFEE